MEIEIDLRPGSFAVTVPSRGHRHVWQDVVWLRDGSVIVGVGDASAPTASGRGDRPEGDVRARTVLAAPSFDPDVAWAAVSYAVAVTLREAGVSWLRGFGGHRLRLTHPGWHEIARADRISFLERPGWLSVEVNGSVVARWRVDLPIVGGILGGRRIAPNGA
jgi:hypothetical protein